MSVSSILYSGPALTPASIRTPQSTGFVVAPSAAALPAAGPAMAAVGPAVSVSAAMILSLQEHASAETGDREARQHGRQLLDALAELQRALLSNGSGDALQRLAALADLPLTATDPVLARAIVAIRLRARVEAARAEAAASRGTGGRS